MSMEIQELTLSGAYSIVLEKSRRRALIHRRHMLQTREQERKLQRPVKEFMDYMTRKLKAGISSMKGKTAAQKAQSIVNWKKIREEGERILEPAILEVLAAGASTVIEGVLQMRKQERIDPIGTAAIHWTEVHSARLVVEITEETMFAIRDIITTGVNAGKSMPVIARELRPIVGLHSQYAGAVDKFHTSLLMEGVSSQRAAAQSSTYANRLHRRRTATIARTETAFGLTEGQVQGYAGMGITHLERVEDPECCEICAEYNGKVYSIKESQGVLPEHPNCEGTWVAAAGQSMEARNFYNHVTDAETEVIQGWSDANYMMTRKYIRAGEIERENMVHQFGLKVKEDADAMQKLFVKYKDGVSDKVLMRGIGELPDDVYNAFKGYKVGSIAEIDTAISSWTTDVKTMEKFANGKNSIRFHLEGGRIKTLELDIKDFSRMEFEKEVILNTHKFRIIAIEEELIPSIIPGSTAPPSRVLDVFLQEVGK